MTKAFEIESIQHHPGDEQLVVATVAFNFDDDMPRGTVTQHVAISVRLSLDESLSLRELHEAIYRKALEQLPRVLSLCESKSAEQLRAEVVEQARRDKEALDNVRDNILRGDA